LRVKNNGGESAIQTVVKKHEFKNGIGWGK
jgi:hypothetical protein